MTLFKRPGRPRTKEPYFGKTLYFYQRHIAWIGNRNASKVIRELINREIEHENISRGTNDRV